MPRPVVVEKGSDPLGEQCALCKQPFTQGDEVILCPQCGAVHHTYCWSANANRCTTLGCSGHGAVEPRPQLAAVATVPPNSQAAAATNGRPRGRATLRPGSGRATSSVVAPAAAADAAPAPTTSSSTVPLTWHTQVAQSCLILAIAIAIVVFAFSCFGLWAIADYFLLDVLGWEYRLLPQSQWPITQLQWTLAQFTFIIS